MLLDRHKLVLSRIVLIGAAALCCLYAVDTYTKFLVSLTANNMLNITSIACAIQRAVFVAVPLLLLAPTQKNKSSWMRWSYIVLGICYYVGCLWVVFFLMEHPFSELSNLQLMTDFQTDNAYVLNYLSWGAYDLWGVIFSIIQGTLFILLGRSFTQKGWLKNTQILLTVTAVLMFLFPLLYPTFTATPLNPIWKEKSALLNAIYALTVLSFWIRFKGRMTFRHIVWL